MRHRFLFALRNNLLREATFSHISVAAGILVVSAALVTGPLSQVSQPQSEPAREALAIAAQLTTIPSDAPEPVAGREVVSARGDRPTSPPAAGDQASSPAATASPAPSAAVPPATVVPTAPPPPTAAPPTAVPTAKPTAVPAAAPPPPPAPAPQLRVGIQAGHWKESELPAELASLRGATGASGSGWRELDVNLDIAQRVAGILRDKSILVDVLPATVPVAYKADAFVAIHGDANSNPSASGYKAASARWSQIPQKDDALVQTITSEYGAATGMKLHSGSITEDMRQYYAFNWPQLQHAVASTTPSAIVETGFLTTASDRKLLLEQPDRAAIGIANGILRFLGR